MTTERARGLADSESPGLDTPCAPSAEAADRAWAERLGQLRGGFLGGVALALAGFALPWFRVGRSYDWWYSGWGFLTTNQPDLAWVALIFLGYALLLAAGWFLPRLGLPETVALAAAAIALACGTLIVVALAAADAVSDQGRVYRLDFNLGLPLLVAGHGMALAAAAAIIVVQTLRLALADRAG